MRRQQEITTWIHSSRPQVPPLPRSAMTTPWATIPATRNGKVSAHQPMRRQTSQFTQFRSLVRPLRLRVITDAEGYPAIPGRYGHLEWFDGSNLAVYCDHPRIFAKLWAIRVFASTRPGPGDVGGLPT
jgi:hypothetical protein